MYWLKHELHGVVPVETLEMVKLGEAAGWERTDEPKAPSVEAPAPEPAPAAVAASDPIFGTNDDDPDSEPAPPAAIPQRGPGRPRKS